MTTFFGTPHNPDNCEFCSFPLSVDVRNRCGVCGAPSPVPPPRPDPAPIFVDPTGRGSFAMGYSSSAYSGYSFVEPPRNPWGRR